MPKPKNTAGRGALGILEEAVHLLRMAPAGLLAAYYFGALPFVLGLLYFWADMSRSGLAYRYVSAAALGLAFLFVWMKCWQTVFARGLLAHIRREPRPRWSTARLMRLTVFQTFIQPIGLVLLPISLVLAFPFPWMYAFFQNTTLLGDGEDEDLGLVVRNSWRQAKIWPKDNHLLLAVLSLFGLFVFLNLALAALSIPFLLRSFLGFETIISRGWQFFLNTTFLSLVCGLTYLCLDPLIKTVYTLRCFYGASLRSGQDLQVELAGFKAPRKGLKTASVLFVVLGSFILTDMAAAAGRAAIKPPAAPVERAASNPSVPPARLRQAIEDVISRNEYTWRLPRMKPPQDEHQEPGLIDEFMDWLAKQIKAGIDTLVRWTRKVSDWLDKLFPDKKPVRETGLPGLDWMHSLNTVLILALAGLALVMIMLFFRSWRKRVRTRIVQAEAVQEAAPDLTDEGLAPDDLSEDGWLTLAKDLYSQGSFRLALRAFYLATLSRLAERELITIAKYKSNRDYEQELTRRARDREDLLRVFSQNRGLFDRAWYGRHQVTEEELDRFRFNYRTITTAAGGETPPGQTVYE
ncbi:MAG: DUF4129 domain-containing protein [Pseudomonadota bacterium]